ncbi:MAG: porin [Verrucomicrobia bacterium]|nr:porin [Verrucomicrobiota bacterium]
MSSFLRVTPWRPPVSRFQRARQKLLFSLTLTAAAVVAAPAALAASDPAMLQLFKILRDRGSITPEEYQLLMDMAKTPDPSAPAAIPLPSAASLAPSPVAPTNAAPASPPGDPAAATPPQVATGAPAATNLPPITVLSGKPATKDKPKWYEKFDIGGYTQFRLAALLDPEADLLNVPNDPSVNPSQLFLIRRGRLRMSGDVSEHLSLYAQVDVSGSVASGSGSSFGVQLRDLYADIFPVESRDYRFRLGQSKVPYGWVNMQSSQNRAPMERPDAINSAAEGERDIGAFFMYAPAEIRKRLKELVQSGLKGSGDYGMVTFGAYNGQGPNRPDLNGTPYWIGRLDYPFKFDSGQFFEVGVQGYLGKFVPTIQPFTVDGTLMNPTYDGDGVTDRRVAVSANWYPQPFGVETEWNVGWGPTLSDDYASIGSEFLYGGHIQFNYQIKTGRGSVFPYVRWNYYAGGRKFGTNSPYEDVNEVDIGFEYAPWQALELSIQYTLTFRRTNTSKAPYDIVAEGANRIEFQAQWNY